MGRARATLVGSIFAGGEALEGSFPEVDIYSLTIYAKKTSSNAEREMVDLVEINEKGPFYGTGYIRSPIGSTSMNSKKEPIDLESIEEYSLEYSQTEAAAATLWLRTDTCWYKVSSCSPGYQKFWKLMLNRLEVCGYAMHFIDKKIPLPVIHRQIYTSIGCTSQKLHYIIRNNLDFLIGQLEGQDSDVIEQSEYLRVLRAVANAGEPLLAGLRRHFPDTGGRVRCGTKPKNSIAETEPNTDGKSATKVKPGLELVKDSLQNTIPTIICLPSDFEPESGIIECPICGFSNLQKPGESIGSFLRRVKEHLLNHGLSIGKAMGKPFPNSNSRQLEMADYPNRNQIPVVVQPLDEAEPPIEDTLILNFEPKSEDDYLPLMLCMED